MSRIAVFAHYDINNTVDDYVLFYINELLKVCDDIVFVSCGNLSDTEKQKLNMCKTVIAEPHDEYDFGSYKRGFLYAKENHLLDNCKELVFVNDSCFGPFKPLKPIFDKMEQSKCDFWGLTKNQWGFILKNGKALDTINSKCVDAVRPHIQSYFFVLRPSVFDSKVFKDFITSVKPENNKNIVIEKYEIGMTELLEEKLYISDFVYHDFYKFNNPSIFFWRDFYNKTDFPFIKCSLLRLKNVLHTTIEGWEDLLTEEQVNMINHNLAYTRSREIRHCVPFWFKNFLFRKIMSSHLRAPIGRKLLSTVFWFMTD